MCELVFFSEASFLDKARMSELVFFSEAFCILNNARICEVLFSFKAFSAQRECANPFLIRNFAGEASIMIISIRVCPI